MLKNISWQNFIVLVTWLLIAWYCFVGIVYYSKDLKRLLKFDGDRFSPKQNHPVIPINENDKTDFVRAQKLQEDIAQVFRRAVQQQSPKEELVMALQVSLRGYPELHYPAFRVAINHYIEQESEKQCSTPFGEEDLRVVWMG